MLEQDAQMKTLYFNVARAHPDETQALALNVAKTLK